MSGRAATVSSIIATVLLVGALVLFARQRRADRLEGGAGELHEAMLVQAEGPVLLSIESLFFSSEDDDETVYRLTTWDALTGKRLARVKEVAWRANTSLDDAVNQRRVFKVDQTFKEVGSTTIGKMAGWTTVKPMWLRIN